MLCLEPLWYGEASLALLRSTKRLVLWAALTLTLGSSSWADAQSSDDLFAPSQPERPVASTPPPPKASEPPPETTANVGKALGPGERDVSLEDRVKAVQHKAFLKTHRFGVSGFGTASMSDAFFQKWGGGGEVAFTLADPFTLSATYGYFHDQETYNVLLAKKVLQSQLYTTQLNQLATLDGQWTPVYGKLQLLNKIVYFDLYALMGFGAANGASGWTPASEAGIGERVFLTDFLSLGLEAKYTFYIDQAVGGPSVLQKVLLMSGLITIWFPGASEGP